VTSCSLGVMIAPPRLEDLDALRRSVADGSVSGLWWPDHWMGWAPAAAWSDVGELANRWPSPDLYADPFAEMAVFGRETGAPILGTCVTDVVRRHPVSVLQSVETVLRLSPESRVVLGIGAGERENLEPYGLPKPRIGRVEEYLDVIRQATSSGRVTIDGDFFAVHDAPVPVVSATDRLEVWVGAHGPRMLALTAQQADGWLPMGFPPGLVAKRKAGMAEHRRPGQAPVTTGVCVVIALVEDHAEAAEIADSEAMKRLALFSGSSVFAAAGHTHPFGADFNPMASYVPSTLSEAEVRAAVTGVPGDVVTRVVRVVTPTELNGLVEEYAAAGVDHLILWDVLHLVRPDSRARSLELLRDARSPASPTGRATHARQ